MLTSPPSLAANDAALFLDVDGTLLEFQQRPGDVVADAGLLEQLTTTSEKLGGALSLITGRAIKEVDRIFAPRRYPVAGAHGTELRLQADGEGHSQVQAFSAGALLALQQFAQKHEGVLAEEKHGGATLHYRRAPELAKACEILVSELLDTLGDDYRMISGKMVFELAPSAHNKGTAIETFLEVSPFSGRQPVFLGDDTTDEDGFRSVNKHNGVSILVGEPRETEANYILQDPAAVRDWIRTAF